MSSENRIDDAVDSDEHVVEVKDKDGVPVFLAEVVWNEHILLRHPEIEPYKDLITQTIENPDVRHIDPEDERVMLYYKAVPEDARPFRKASLYLFSSFQTKLIDEQFFEFVVDIFSL